MQNSITHRIELVSVVLTIKNRTHIHKLYMYATMNINQLQIKTKTKNHCKNAHFNK